MDLGEKIPFSIFTKILVNAGTKAVQLINRQVSRFKTDRFIKPMSMGNRKDRFQAVNMCRHCGIASQICQKNPHPGVAGLGIRSQPGDLHERKSTSSALASSVTR